LMPHSRFSSLFLTGSPHPNLKQTQFSSFSTLWNLVRQIAINYIKAKCYMTYSVTLRSPADLRSKIKLCQFSNTSLQSTLTLSWSIYDICWIKHAIQDIRGNDSAAPCIVNLTVHFQLWPPHIQGKNIITIRHGNLWAP
jgi:hypothetical protein